MNPLFSQNDYPINDPAYLKRSDADHPKDSFKKMVSLIQGVYSQKPMSLVDVGCASGAFIEYALKKLTIRQCTGVDISDAHLKLAQQQMPQVEWLNESILAPQRLVGRQFDVCTCIGMLSIFDELDPALTHLLRLLKKGGYLYIYDLVHDDPIDVLMRYRTVQTDTASSWKSGLNVRSLQTYQNHIRTSPFSLTLKSFDFHLPVAIPKSNDPMRAWTIKTEHNPHQIVVGTGQLLNFKILEIQKLS